MRVPAFVAFLICICGYSTAFALDFKPVSQPDAGRDAWTVMTIVGLIAGAIAGIRDVINRNR